MPQDESTVSSQDRRRSATLEERRRSRSPRRDANRPRHREGGFKWKEKRRNDDEEQKKDGQDRLERGYKEHYRARSPLRDPEAKDIVQQPKTDEVELPENETNEREKEKMEEKKRKKEKKKEKKEKKVAATPTSGEAMIIVNINDRLGTKAAIPCFASDPIKLFKAQVAARIGREPHEISLKRQGERPFKDQLTLEDYGVSNGVQLDLEVDTGD